MPKYKVNGSVYNIPDNKIEAFERRYPDATISMYDNDGTAYSIPLSKREMFQKKYDKWSYDEPQNNKETKEESISATDVEKQQVKESPQPVSTPIKSTFDYEEWEQMSPDEKFRNAGNVVQSDQKPWTMQQEAAWSTLTPESRKVVIGNDDMYNKFEEHLQANETRKLQQANREQVAELVGDIDSELSRRGKELDIQAMKPENRWMNLPRGSGGAIHTFSSVSNNGRMADQEYKDLTAAKSQLTEAQRIINEADINAKNGTLGEWLQSSFAGGAARGFGQKFFDVSTWDYGLTDLSNNLSVMQALEAYDSGKELTRSQEMMLDAMAVKLATDAYFGSYVGRGYKAGSVTAESIPFMLEMCVNPLSSTGKAASSKLTRYALERFGKKALKEHGKKYVAAKTATRVAGDVAGALGMASTTGSARVAADAIDRMSGDITYETDMEDGVTYFTGHTEGDDALTAFNKALASTTIENYSEMVGNYFAPVLNLAGKGVTKGLDKIGLGAVNRFMDDVAASDVAKLVSDFESSSQWNGVIGEYAEEVAGGIMNALIVGDQTLDADENTGVFNLDHNIDTFLGVSLLGGFMSSIKTAGYRTPKYRARKDMEGKDNVAALAFGNQETWGGIRNSIAFGNEEEVKIAINDVLSNESFTEEQKKAALDYAKSVETYRGMLKGEEKRRTEEDPLQVDMETSFDNGYSLESSQEQNDAKNMYDYQRQRALAIIEDDYLADIESDPAEYLDYIINAENWNDEERGILLDYLNAKATYDGLIQKVQDGIDGKIAHSDAIIDANSNSRNEIQPATMKVDDRQVYVISGNLVMNEDGTGIDHEKSDEFIVIRDAQTGKLESTSPYNVLSVQQPVNAEDEKRAMADRIKQEEAQKAADRIEGVLPFNAGDTYTVTDEQGNQSNLQVVANEQGLVDNGDGTVNMSADGVTVVAMPREQVQQMVEATNMTRLSQYEEEKAEKRALEAEAEREASRPEYNLNDELSLRLPEGTVVRGSVVSPLNEDGKIEVYTETPVNGKKVHLFTADELDSMLVGMNNEAVTVPPRTQESDDSVLDSMEKEQMPMIGEGEEAEPDFASVTPERAYTYIYDEAGLSTEEANNFIEANIAEKKKVLDKVKKAQPKMGTSIAKYRKEQKEWQEKVDAANAQADYWNGIKAERQRILAEEATRRQEEQAKITEQAIIEEQARIEEERRKAEEQARIGTNNVSPIIREKWESAPKIEGAKNEVVLANGEKVSGRYILVESGVATASHNAMNGFSKTEGFPIDENGQNVNDRDYERDQDAQNITRQIAGNYDSRAIQSPVIVSNDGVVLSGNGRTMAGEMAAANNTDAAYIEYLKQYPEQFGFSKEQVDRMQHPRVLFVPDESMPYTSETFAKFNQQEMKGQSKTEQAVKLGKVVDDSLFSRIVRKINSYDTLGDFYADNSATREVIRMLQQAGIINDVELAALLDGETISAQGKEMLENILIGKAFESNPDAVRQITSFKSIRQSVITALAEISNNIMLGGEYSLEEELSQAISLVYNARMGGIKAGEQASIYARQGNLFQLDEGATVAEYSNATVMMLADVLNDNRTTRLKKALSVYNQQAKESAQGQMDLFSGTVKEKQDVLDQVNQLLNYGTEEQQQAAIEQAIEQRKAEASSVQQDGSDGNGSEVNEIVEITNAERAEMGNRIVEWLSEENLSRASGKTRSEIFEEFGNELMPIAYIPTQFLSLVSPEIKDQRIYCGKGYFIDHALRNHAGEGVQASIENVDVSKYLNIQAVLDNPDHIKETYVDGKRTIVFIKKIGRFFAELTQVEENGKVVLHKSFFNQKKEPYAKLNDIRQEDTSSEGGTSSISHTVETVPAISLQSRGDVISNDKSLSSENKDSDIPLNNKEMEEKNEEDRLKRIEVTEDESEQDGKYGKTYLRKIMIDGIHEVTQVDEANSHGDYTGSYFMFNNQRYGDLIEILDYIDGIKSQIDKAREEVDTSPTDAQKEAGNYRKGHIKIDGYEITIENPKGGTRSGTDKNGKKWSVTMNNDYGYIRGTEAVDGDHIDVFLSDNPEQGNVFVVDQLKEDGTFDESKVMYGFRSLEEARAAYLSNYSEGWENRIGAITGVTKDEFKKWIESSHRKTKAFAEYKTVKTTEGQNAGPKDGVMENTKAPSPDFDFNEVESLKDAGRTVRKAIEDYASWAYYNAIVKIPVAQFGVPEDKIIRMTYDKFCDEFEKLNRYMYKKVLPYLPDVYEYMQQRLAVKSQEMVKEAGSRSFQPQGIQAKNAGPKEGNLKRQLADFNEGDVVRDFYDKKLYRIKKHSKNGVSTIALLDAEGNEIATSQMNANNNARYSLAEAPVKVERPTISQESEQVSDQDNAQYTIAPAQYTTKKGKVLDMFIVKFASLSKEQQRAAKELAKAEKGWYDAKQGGFMMRSEESAKQLAKTVIGNEEAVSDAQPVSMTDIQALNNGEAMSVEPNKESSAIKMPKEGELYKNNIAGGNAVAKIRGVGEAGFLVGFASDLKEAEADFFMGESIVPAEEMRKWISQGDLTRMPVQKENKETDVNPSGNRLVTDERYAALRERMRKKLGGQMNIGIDPEILAIGTEMAVYHLEKGARKFAEYATAMIADLGDAIRPYLKAFYNGARNLPEVESSGIAADMTPYDEVQQFNVATFGKENTDPFTTAEIVVAEQAHQEEAEQSKQEIINQRNTERRKKDEQTSANTQTIASQAEAVASEAERSIEEAATEEEVNEAERKLDEQLTSIDGQLSELGYIDNLHSGMRVILKDGRNVLLSMVMHSGEQLSATQFSKPRVHRLYGIHNGQLVDVSPADVDVEATIRLNESVEDSTAQESTTAAEESYNGFKRGDRVMYTPQGKGRKAVEATIHDFETYGEHKPVLDTGLAPVLYEVVDWKDIKPIGTETKGDKPKKSKKKSVTSQQTSKLDLFGNLFDNEKNNEDGLQGNDAVRSEGVSANSSGKSERGSGTGNSQTVREESGRTDRIGESGSGRTGSEVSESDERSSGRVQGLDEKKNTRNNHVERGKDYAPKSVDSRIEANFKAIELMQQLVENGELATPEQMAILRKFSGWGGLGKAFNQAETAKRLRELLGEEAYEQANMSRNSAYFTPANIIDALWDIARAMGFKGGNVLEGSAGIGNIIGLMPTDLSERSDIHAVEIDTTTGNILSLLYPDAKVEVQGFEATGIQNGSVDLAITNVPFVTGLRVRDTTGDKDLSNKFHDIHDFCIAKNVRKLREGGIGIFITSSGTLDNSTKLRQWVISEGDADFVGAFRLNNETFGGTGATSDIIVIRKRVNGNKSPHSIDVNTVVGERVAEYDTGETKKTGGSTVHIVKNLSLDYNKYFIEHPEMMGGEMYFAFEKGETFRQTSKALYPSKEKDQSRMLNEWAESFAGKDWHEDAVPSRQVEGMQYEKLGADVKEGSMFLDANGNLCIAHFGKAVPLAVNANKVKGHTKAECFKAYQRIKRAVAELLQFQMNHEDDNGLKPLLDEMNRSFDDFIKTYGHLHRNTSISFLKNDVDFPGILALETHKETADEKGNLVHQYGKSDIFKGRVVEKEKEPAPRNIKDAIIASIYKYGRVDIPYISGQLGIDKESVRRGIVTEGLGFENPSTRQMEVSYEYLSGNVREKLQIARDNNVDGTYDANIKALEKVLPMDIPSHLIDFTLGSSWIDPKLYEDYVKERTGIDVNLTNVGGTWFMKTPYWVNEEKNRSMGIYSEMLRKRILGTALIEAAIQNKTITVSETHKKWDGTTEVTVDKEATAACTNKIDEIRLDFKDWARDRMQTDPQMSARIEKIYNDMFNNYVPTAIPDEFIPKYFGGATHKFTMRPHQGRAIVRGTMQPLLLAHEVGTGKTFTLISIAMEMRRLGTARKPMVVVQNATVGQFVESAKELYPNAKVLTLEDKDHTGEGRRNFYAKIKYNDWDMIVVPQSVFERIPDSEERQMKYIQDKIEEKMIVLEQMKDADPDGSSMITRQAEKEIDKLQEQLAELTDAASAKRKEKDEKKEAVTRQNAEVKAREMLDRATDDVENFDDMGIDAILVDEAHEYKHLGFATSMQRGVKGIDPSYSKKAQGVFLKAQAVLEKNNGRNVIFATGTPISNTAAEIWTFMRYLMPADTMKEYGIFYFDDFVRNFGSLQQMLEFTTSGKFKENNRFAGYVNLPELVRIWSGIADTVLTREAEGVNDKIPQMEGGKAQDIYLPQTKALRSVMKYVKQALDRFDAMSGKEKKQNSHIPLTMYGIAKAAAVDVRLVVSDAQDDPNSKTNEAVRQTLRSLNETKEYKGTVALFADNYQNKDSGFNLYEDIRKKLIAEGVPAEQIVIMKSGMSVKKKLEIFDKVNSGDIRVIMGSTFTLGTGVNIQERLHTLIHLDAPNRPMDYTQRNGRILRQGNLHKDMGKAVRVLRFGVEDSLDVTAYQRLKTKGAIAESIMNGKQMMANSMDNRVLEEEEDVFGDTVAQLSGSEYAMLKNQAEKDVRKYEAKKKQWEYDQTYIHNQSATLEGQIRKTQGLLEQNRKNLEVLSSVQETGSSPTITIGKQSFSNMEEMADFIKEYNKKIKDEESDMRENVSRGQNEHKLTVVVNGIEFEIRTTITTETLEKGNTLFYSTHRKMVYSCPALALEEVPVTQSLLRNAITDIVENVVSGADFRERETILNESLERSQESLKQIREREGKPFAFSEELKQSRERLSEYSELMKKEMADKEAKYAEMDAGVETADKLTNAEEEDDTLYRSDDTMYRIREEAAPKNTGIGYKVFVLKNGELYPPKVANPNGEPTPVGVWLNADEGVRAEDSKTGRPKVKAGGKGTDGGSGTLAYRPGWHLGEIPYALQFNRNDENGERTLFPANFVWAEVEYANDVDYQEEAMSYGYNKNGKFQHSYAGLPRVPENGAYTYRTNPNPETDPWIITGAMRVKRLLTPTEVDEIVKSAGRVPQRRQDGAVTDEQINALNAEMANDYRDGVGVYNDDAVSFENDPVSKVLGKPRRTAAQRKAFAERERKRMVERVESLAKKLHLDNVEVITDASQLEGKKRRAKGFFSKRTGKITIVIPNHSSVFDAEQTLLHEAVAHYGLRKLFGEHFDTFLDNVFNNAEEGIRKRIVALAARNGWDFHKATEEYLAMLAEDTEFENINASWWRQIKDFFLNMLHKIGFEGFRGVTLTDNELRYILWRSYENLAEPGRYRSILGEAVDVAKQNELQVGNYSAENAGSSNAAESNDELYRDGDPEIHERTLARDRYERRVKSGMFQSQEALQDSMLGLKEAMQAILGDNVYMEDVDGFENAYLGENRLSSVNKAEADAFAQTLFKPMLDEVSNLAKNDAEREELTDYMMAKHGLERNLLMAENAANEAVAAGDVRPFGDILSEYRERDYAGLTALTGMDNVADAEMEAQQMVTDYEQAHDTADLWNRVNAVSKAILQKSYESGLMSKETFDKISGMYEFYIPLRGFDEKTSAEAYAYLTHKQSAFNAPVKKAEGRKSKADDPFANLESMAESAIMQGNRNRLVKQRFFNFVLNHPSDLVSVNDLWIEYDAVTDEWKPVFPDNIESTDTPEEVERKLQDFETKMDALSQQYPDQYKKGKDAIGIPYRVVESRDMRQHQVIVKRGGRDYVITINGNPRAAQALNGQTNPDNDMSGAIGAILRAGEQINRQLSAFYTTRNPDFIVSNFMRDMLYTNSMAWIKENPNYALRFHRNYLSVNPVAMKRLLAKYRKGELDMNDKTESMFYQFMMNGGETGYANIRDIEQHKNDIRKELKRANGKLKIGRAWSLLAERLDELNRAVENCARFAAFITSREMGRSIDRAIYDAKEISVNFNKKGSGAKFYDSVGQTKTGNASALISGLGRSGYVFWNAAVQGTTNFGRQLKRHPAKAYTGMAAMFLLGAIVAYLGGDDDEDDKNAYYNLPEYVRRSNILFRAGDSWISIPLPIEYRAFYGMGELMTSVLNGKEHLTGGEIAEAIAGQMTQILPIDFLEGGGGLNAFVPSAAKPIWEAYVVEKSWTGMPLYKDTPYNKEMPEWTKAYKSTNKHIVNLAAVLNEVTGGDPYTKGAVDFNPAKVEYMLNGYFGGVFGTIDKMSKTAETVGGEREYDPRSILLVNRLVKAGDERTEYRAVNNEYFRLKEEHDRLKNRMKHYEEDTDNGVFDYAEKIDFLYNSPEYERYEIFEDYRKDIDDLYKELGETVDKEERKDIEFELNELKKQMIQEMNLTRKR